MDESKIKDFAKAIDTIDNYLREKYTKSEKNKLWENTYISKQIAKREEMEKGGKPAHFPIKEHIRGMVYAMLTNGAPWKNIVENQCCKTGQFTELDKIFCEYDPECLKARDSKDLTEAIKEKKCGGLYTRRQMKVLKQNIEMLEEFKKRSGTGYIDDYYKQIEKERGSVKELIKALSSKKNDSAENCKLQQMAEALNAEYLRNMGYNIAKPDRHIRRMLGCERLNFTDKKEAGIFEAMEIVEKIAEKRRKKTAETDYILWSYCAKCFGDICTAEPKCEKCVIKDFCKGCGTK